MTDSSSAAEAARAAILDEIAKRAAKVPGSEQLRNLAEAYAYVMAPERAFVPPSPPAEK